MFDPELIEKSFSVLKRPKSVGIPPERLFNSGKKQSQ